MIWQILTPIIFFLLAGYVFIVASEKAERNKVRVLIVRFRYAVWAFKRRRQPHLMDAALYMGQRGILIQGVSKPYWNVRLDVGHTAKFVHESEFKIDMSLRAQWTRIKQDYRFQVNYWLKNDTFKQSAFEPYRKL